MASAKEGHRTRFAKDAEETAQQKKEKRCKNQR